MSVYGRFFKIYMYSAIAPVPLSTFAGQPTENVGKTFLKSYCAVLLEGAIIVLACVIFSVFASSPPTVRMLFENGRSFIAYCCAGDDFNKITATLMEMCNIKAKDNSVEEITADVYYCCGKAYPANMQFCTVCGRKLRVPPPKPKENVPGMEYPPIIKKEEFIEANSKRLLKGGTREKDSKEIAWLKEHSYCEQCGKRFSRRSHWSHSREKWGYGCGCSQDVYIDDAYFFNKINTVINKVINAPKMLSVDDATKRYEPTLDIIREGKEINRMLEQPNSQFAVIKAAIYQSVSNKYSVAEMDNSGEFTALLIDHFEQIEHIDNLNLELLIKTVERISVKKNGEIIVTFINKATIESEENSNGTSTEPTVTENSYEN